MPPLRFLRPRAHASTTLRLEHAASRALGVACAALLACGEPSSTAPSSPDGSVGDARVRDGAPQTEASLPFDATPQGDCGVADEAPQAPLYIDQGFAPKPSGGTIQDGTYHLVESTMYLELDVDAGARTATGKTASTTVYIAGNRFDLAGKDTKPVQHTGTFSIQGDRIEIVETCPSAGALATYWFSASDAGLDLFARGPNESAIVWRLGRVE